jgi:hypothetical protein
VYFSPVFYPLNPRSAQKAGQGAFLSAAVLFARADSVYKSLPHLDVYDAERDARTWPGGIPAIAHPPCRAWGRLRQFANPRPDEKELALYAVEMVRRYGGVLEHPAESTLWEVADLPRPGYAKDRFGGFTYCINQSWWGHPAPKATWLYIVGAESWQLPDVPFHLGVAAGRVESLSRKAREATPVDLAKWLVDLATRIHANRSGSVVTPGQSLMVRQNTSFCTTGQTAMGGRNHD